MLINIFSYLIQGGTAALTLLSPQVAQANSSPDDFKVVNVGIYAPFSDEQAYIGRNILGAVELARDEIPSKKVVYSFYTLDEVSESAHAQEVLQRFIATNHIQVLFTGGATDGRVVSQIAKDSNLLHFNISNDQSIADGAHNFMALSPANKKAQATAQRMNPKFIANYQKNYMNSPRVEAGYAYDIFLALNKGVVTSLPASPEFSASQIASAMLNQKQSNGVLGAINMSQNGVLLAGSLKDYSESVG